MQTARSNNVNIYPVDSEHSAIFQCLQGNKRSQVSRLILTASGGPFRGYTRQMLENVTKEQALKHPNWSMGAKITIDSSTLMNKGLEFIEAMWLFDCKPEDIQVVVHKQSIIHSAVEFQDGAIIAQLGSPDMRVPIQYALTYPERFVSPAAKLDLLKCKELTFEEPDMQVFTPLADCIEAVKRGGLYPCIVNGANEEAVALFLADKIRYTDIFDGIRYVLDTIPYSDYSTEDEVIAADKQARECLRKRFGL